MTELGPDGEEDPDDGTRPRNDPGAGPPVISRANPRYFTVASGDRAGKAIYLTGSHIWNNF